MILVAGATGLVGAEVCRLLAGRGHDVRAMVRPTSRPDRIERLRRSGAAIVEADLKNPATLEAACRGVATVVSTASATVSRGDGDSIESVDGAGQLALVEAAERAGAGRFVYVSFAEMPVEFPLQRAKRAVERRLQASALGYTILKPVNFMEVWLGPHLGFDPLAGRVRVFGSGTAPVSWISFGDVAQFAAAVIDSPAALNRSIDLGGPEALSPLEVVALFERMCGKTVVVDHVPEAALEAQLASAPDSLQATLAGLALSTARGCCVTMEATLREFPVPLTSVRDYAARLYRDPTSPA
jgi:uncharacterized protein YbjT (DUF2867 family)